MFKTLFKNRLSAFLSYYASAGRKRSGRSDAAGKGSKILFALLMLYAFVVFVGLFFSLFLQLANSFGGTEYAWLYFALYVILSFALMFLGSVFTAKTQLFEAHDNEFLLSMPIPPAYILGSRMAALAALNLLFQSVAVIPALAAWCVSGHATAGGVLAFLLLLPALNLFSLAITSLIAWLLSILTSRMRRKNLMTVIFSVICMLVYFLVIGRMNTYVSTLAVNGAQIADRLRHLLPLVWLGQAMRDGTPLMLLASMLLLLVPFAIVYFLLSLSFIRIVTAKRGGWKRKYRRKETPQRSPAEALLRREFARLGSSAGYMLNAGLGALFLILLAGFLLFGSSKVQALTQAFDLDASMITLFLCAIECLLLSTVTFSASSISLEGKNLWILRASPCSTKEILRAKYKLHADIATIAAALPTVGAFLLIGPDYGAVLLCLVLSFANFTAGIGLVENLRHPNLTWQNEMQPLKQGLSVLFSMLITMGAVILPALFYVLFHAQVDARVFLLVCSILFMIADALLLRWIDRQGVNRFENLS